MCAIKRHATWVINTRKYPNADPMFFRKKGVEGWGAAKEYRDCRRGGGDGGGGVSEFSSPAPF